MAVIKRMSSKAKVSKIENYLKSEEKTSENLISALNCDSENFAKECQMTSELYNKNQNKEDRKYYHIVQSFSPQDNERLTHEQAHQIGKEFAEKNFKGYEVLIVTHKDKDHIHNHFVVNSVSYENGLKYRADNKSLLELRKTSNELCKKNNLTHSIQDLNKRAKDKMPTGELREIVRGGESWKQDLKAKIEDVAGKSRSKEEFKAGLQQKYNIALTERTRKSKGKLITIYEYQSEEMRKPCGEHRLGVDY
ncbi:MAG: relaxase/mobilization nuclease domain-containing protein, partial [Anaerotignaceae bacterium]